MVGVLATVFISTRNTIIYMYTGNSTHGSVYKFIAFCVGTD